MDIYERIAAKREEILELAARFGIKNIRIFGSVARHEAREGSDIDFLVEFPPGTSLFEHAEFQQELAEPVISDRQDLLHKTSQIGVTSSTGINVLRPVLGILRCSLMNPKAPLCLKPFSRNNLRQASTTASS